MFLCNEPFNFFYIFLTFSNRFSFPCTRADLVLQLLRGRFSFSEIYWNCDNHAHPSLKKISLKYISPKSLGVVCWGCLFPQTASSAGEAVYLAAIHQPSNYKWQLEALQLSTSCLELAN